MSAEHPEPAIHSPSDEPAQKYGEWYINITRGLQAFYAARGMWINGKPSGELRSMLGPRAPVQPSNPAYGTVYFVTLVQINDLIRDIRENGPRGLTSRQMAQSLRRLREAARHAGAPFTDHSPRSSRARPTHIDAVPFDGLVCPPESNQKARKAFEKHAFDCLRAVVDFSQQSAYASEGGFQATGDLAPLTTGGGA